MFRLLVLLVLGIGGLGWGCIIAAAPHGSASSHDAGYFLIGLSLVAIYAFIREVQHRC